MYFYVFPLSLDGDPCRLGAGRTFWVESQFKISLESHYFLHPRVRFHTGARRILTARAILKSRNRILDNPTTAGGGGLHELIPLARLPLSPGNDLEADVSTTSEQPPTSDGVQHISSCPVSQNLVGGTEKWGLEHGYLIRMGALKIKLKQGDSRFPSIKGVEKLAAGELLPTARFLNEKIKALSKSDKLAKTVVCFQVSWLVLQTIARRIERLPITLLELNTIAQVWVTLVLYWLWWNKPQGVAEAVEVDFSDCKKCLTLLRDAELVSKSSTGWAGLENQIESNIKVLGLIPLVMGVYIAIDALGWNAYFPCRAEMIVWRVSVCVFVGGMIVFLAGLLLDTLNAIMIFSIIFGVLGRTGLTIEAFTNLRSLPLGAYSTPSWTDMLPHIG
jgi:hypothetical protein